MLFNGCPVGLHAGNADKRKGFTIDLANMEGGRVNYSNEVTQPKEQEVFWHFWYIPPGLKRDEAIEYFDRRCKPRGYTYEKFRYDVGTGRVGTV